MEVMLRQSLVLKIKKTQTKTFTASKHDILEMKQPHTEFFHCCIITLSLIIILTDKITAKLVGKNSHFPF